ncbi:MAG TPA: 2-phosphosulfolactate phosphatase [Bacteroidota bacterium]|nr:2-phosphosulfolactate phosphatase [Bacteroidota bacterium]
MKIDLVYTAAQIDELQVREKNVVIIDVLRSSTTIATALYNGAREIIPVASIESAVKISGSLFGEVTLRGGERNGKIIEGFNLGNSPREYTESTVRGKSIIFCTTNGSVAMYRSRFAKNMAVGSFVNLSTIVQYIRDVGNDFLLVCSGGSSGFGSFSMEDSVCAGMIIQHLQKADLPAIELTDSSRAALALHKSFGKSILKMIRESDHGRYLAEIGLGDDLRICSDVDSIPVLPAQMGTVIKLKSKEIRLAEGENFPSASTANA